MNRALDYFAEDDVSSKYISIYDRDISHFNRVVLPNDDQSRARRDGVTFKIGRFAEDRQWLLTISPSSMDLEKAILLEEANGRKYFLICHQGTIAVGYVDDPSSVLKIDVPACILIEYSPLLNLILCAGLFNFAIIRPGMNSLYVNYVLDVESIKLVDERILEVTSFDQVRGPEIFTFDVGNM